MDKPNAVGVERVDGRRLAAFKYYDFAMAAFVAVILCSNLIGAAKPAAMDFGGREFVYGAGILFFPVSYVLGDVLTEVYGYAAARRVVWTGLAATLFASFMAFVVIRLPHAEGWDGQAAYEFVYGQTPRIVAASIAAFWAGELSNAYVLAKLKVASDGKRLWMRTIGSTVVGQGVDSLIFYPLAFLGVWTNEQVVAVLITNYVLKVVWEALLTPVTYLVIGRLKRAEGVDVFDRSTDFSPFRLGDATKKNR
ncbi:MAG: queuosine precursor transporter [Parvularculaceae bacterium]